MSVQSEKEKVALTHECFNCRSEMLLPTWVSQSEYDAAVFQCPICDTEAEIDISNYPKTRVRVVVNEWNYSPNVQGGC